MNDSARAFSALEPTPPIDFEPVNAAYKGEVIHRGKPWRSVADVELATAQWVASYNQEGLHEALGYVPPAEY